jgi:aspartate/methionine/tyrosine aminotransferase
MMIIPAAHRLENMSEYYFSFKLEQIRKMNLEGEPVINLGIGSPDLAPRLEVQEAAIRALRSEKNHGYASYRSLPEFRKALADWYEQLYAVSLDPNHEILPLLGSKEGLFYLAMAFLNPGDQALVPNPGYPAYAAVTRLAGAEPVSYSLSESEKWHPDWAQINQMDLSKVKLMWVNYPHMPTGASGSAELFEKIIEFGKTHKILICHDNPYGQVLNQTKPLSILGFDRQLEVAVELNSFSKAFNMAGWRVGTLMARREILDTVLKVKSNVDSGMFLPVQLGAIEALGSPESWHQERNQVYQERKEMAQKIFDKIGFSYDPNQVGLFIWAKAPSSVVNVEQRIEQILNRVRVFLTPGFIFGTQGERYARCSLCAPVEKLSEALSRLEAL